MAMIPVTVGSTYVLISDGTKSGVAQVVQGSAKYTIADDVPAANAPSIPFTEGMQIYPGPKIYAKSSNKANAVISVALY